MKTKTILIAAVMFFALSVAAFAQATFTVGSSPVTTVACCGQTELTGDISFSPVQGSGNTVTGTLTVNYPVPITNLTPLPAGVTTGIGVTSTVTGAGGTAPAVSINQQYNDLITGKGVVVISVGPGGINPFAIVLHGVRVDVSTLSPGSVNLSSSVSSVNNYLVVGELEPVVIRFINLPLGTPTATAVSVNAVTGGLTGASSITVPEGFLNAFGVTPASDTSTNVSVMIRLKVSAVPAGTALSFPVNDSSGLFQLANAAGTFQAVAQAVTAATSPAIVYYRVVVNTNPLTLESLVVPITVTAPGPYPVASGSVSITAHIAPISATGALIPRFADLATCETAAVTVLNVAGSSTTLLIPYAQTNLGYDTGLAIANTTTDPGTAAMGFTQAVRQGGIMTFYLYPAAGGTPIVYATAAGSPGNNLDSTGALLTGKSYTVMLSEILAKAGVADFTGYIFVVCNFTNAHGEFFISDFEKFTHGALMLVVNNAGTTRAAPEALNN
jgi:hypothetical protein